MLRNGNHEALDEPPVTIGSKIKQARLNAGLKRPQLAERVGVTAKTIENWEADSAEPPLKRLKAISTVLDVPLQEFFDEIEVESEEDVRDPKARRDQKLELARRKLQEAAQLLGGTVLFPGDEDEAGDEPKSEGDDASMALAAFDRVQNIVTRRRYDPAELTAAYAELDKRLGALDYDGLHELAEKQGISLAGCAAPKDVNTAAQRKTACDIELRILMAALNVDLSTFTYKQVDALTKQLNELLGKAADFKDAPSRPLAFAWDGDDVFDKWIAQMRPVLSRNIGHVVAAGKFAELAESVVKPKPAKPANGNKAKRSGNASRED